MRRCLLALLCLAFAPCRFHAAQPGEPANAVMVIVNDSVITTKDVMLYVGPTVDLLMRQYASRPTQLQQKLRDAQREGVEQLVERRLILDEFKRAGYTLPESIIDDRVRDRIRERYGDRLNLTKTLQAEGMTLEQFREKIREEFLVSVMRSRNVSQEIIISPYKIEKYYNENLAKFKVEDSVKLRRIVVNQPAGAEPGRARKLAQEIMAKLAEGASFEDMAIIYSGADESKWWTKAELRKELADVAFAMKPGQRSDIIETKEACWIILVEDARSNFTRSLPEVRDEIEKTLVTQERARLNKQWIERLKEKSFIRYF